MRINFKEVLNETNVTADKTSDSLDIRSQMCFGFQVTSTGTLAGIVQIELSWDKIEWTPITVNGSADLITLTGSDIFEYTQKTSAGYVRAVFKFSSGTGNLIIKARSKGVS